KRTAFGQSRPASSTSTGSLTFATRSASVSRSGSVSIRSPKIGRGSRSRAQSKRLGVEIVLSGRPFLVDKSDKPLHDVLTCIRQHLTLDQAGQRLLPNARAHMLSTEAALQLGRDRDLGRAIARSREIADACRFELGQLHYEFPAYGNVDADAELRRKTR